MRLGKVIAACCLLLLTANSNAHLLNMTDLHLDASDPGAIRLHVKIDLGQSLLSAEEYWRVASARPDEQATLLAPAVTELVAGLEVLVDGEPARAKLDSWQLEAQSLAAIENPLSPQMAVLTFTLASASLLSPELSPDVIQVRIDDNLEVPWPALLRVDSARRELPVSRLLTAYDRSSRPISLSADASAAGSSALGSLAATFQSWIPGLSWLAIGFQHIIPWGLDHIVFVLGLFFLSTKLSLLFYQVSCFTLAHSLSLALATLGIITVPAGIVEPLIAASIIYIAVDNLHSDLLVRWRLLVVTLFGLLHGLGFASALSELMLPSENFLMALFMFNLGVEAGQVAVLILAFAAVGWLRNKVAYRERVARPATMTIAGIGTYWLFKTL